MTNYLLYKIDRWDTDRLISVAVIVAMLLAAWMQYIQHGWINTDSVLYFEQARLFVNGRWSEMFALFKWPFYPVCIGIWHKLTGLSIHQSAQYLNVIFFGISTLSFLKIIRLLHGNNRTIFFGVALLFSAQYIVGDVLEMLMRDEGFWAFYLSGLYFFIRFLRFYKFKDAIFWQFCLIIATLFRLEGVVYLFLLPSVCLLLNHSNNKKPLKFIISSYAVCLVIAVVAILFLFIFPSWNNIDFGRLQEVFDSNLYTSLTKKLYAQSTIMGESVLGRYLDEYATVGLLMTFLTVLVSKSVSAAGLIPFILAYISIKDKNSLMDPTGKQVLLTLSIICLAVASLIIIKVFVLSQRYVVALTWILLIFASFELTKRSLSTRSSQRLFIAAILLIMMLGTIKNILPKSSGYNYRQDAVHWIKQNSENEKSVFYDDNRMIYFAGAPFKGRWVDNWQHTLKAIADGSILSHHYLALSYSIKTPEQLLEISQSLPMYKEVKRFGNRKNRKFIIIFERQY